MKDLKDVQEEIIWPRLDKYKEAWMREIDMNKVIRIKQRLLNEIKETASECDEAIPYFESQCSQIEARWVRPEQSGPIVN